jgi:hypothetical protein
MGTINELTTQWQQTKAALEAAQEAHLQSEIAIYEAVKDTLPDKGTTTLDTGLKIVTGYTESWDQEKLNEVYNAWDFPMAFPFKGEWKPDGKAVSYLREHAPQLYGKISYALTMKPKKPSFSMKG